MIGDFFYRSLRKCWATSSLRGNDYAQKKWGDALVTIFCLLAIISAVSEKFVNFRFIYPNNIFNMPYLKLKVDIRYI